MQENDIVIMPRKLTSQIAIGRVKGAYEYLQVHTAYRHTRPVEWLRPDVPREVFKQDLLYSFGAFMTVCNISRNDAAQRVMTVLEGNRIPAPASPEQTAHESLSEEDHARGNHSTWQNWHMTRSWRRSSHGLLGMP